jgi:methyl coenzyme M reductase gamma subunit
MVFSLLLAIAACFLLITLGRIRKGDPYAYFMIETSLFDSDNIGALNMTVHKTLIRTLDNSGIDISNLRLKRDFKGGRRDENF